MKKIIYIHHGDLNGGAPRSLRFLIERLNKEKYQPTVIYRKNEGDAKFFQDAGAKTIFESSYPTFSW